MASQQLSPLRNETVSPLLLLRGAKRRSGPLFCSCKRSSLVFPRGREGDCFGDDTTTSQWQRKDHLREAFLFCHCKEPFSVSLRGAKRRSSLVFP